MQQEVFTKGVIDKTLKENFLSKDINPFMYLDIVDVRVNVYHLSLDEEYSDVKKFSSYKLKNYKFIDLDDLFSKNNKFRMGLSKIGLGYQKYLDRPETMVEYKPILIKSDINLELSQLALEYLK